MGSDGEPTPRGITPGGHLSALGKHVWSCDAPCTPYAHKHHHGMANPASRSLSLKPRAESFGPSPEWPNPNPLVPVQRPLTPARTPPQATVLIADGSQWIPRPPDSHRHLGPDAAAAPSVNPPSTDLHKKTALGPAHRAFPVSPLRESAAL